jgi:hypothetical protein
VRQRDSQCRGQVADFFEAAGPEAMWPSAVSVGLAGRARLERGDVAGPSLAPLYVQRSEAELLWEARQTIAKPRESTITIGGI